MTLAVVVGCTIAPPCYAAQTQASAPFTEQALVGALGRFWKPIQPAVTIHQNRYLSETVLVPLMGENTLAARDFKAILMFLQENRARLKLDPISIQRQEDQLWGILKKQVPEEEDLMKPVALLIIEPLRELFGVEKVDDFVDLARKQILSRPAIQSELEKIKKAVLKQHRRVLNTREVYPAMLGLKKVPLNRVFRPIEPADRIILAAEFESLVKRLLKGIYSRRSETPDQIIHHALIYVRTLHGKYDAWALKSGGVPLMLETRPPQRRLAQAA